MNVTRRGALGRSCDDEIGHPRRLDHQAGRIAHSPTPFRINRCASKAFELRAEVLNSSLTVLPLVHHALAFKGHSSFHHDRRRNVGRRDTYQARIESLPNRHRA